MHSNPAQRENQPTLRKKAERLIDKNKKAGILRRELFLGFLKPGWVSVISLWESTGEGEDDYDDDDEEYQIRGVNIVFSLSESKQQKLVFDEISQSKIDLNEIFATVSLDEMKAFMINEPRKEQLIIIYPNPAAKGYEILSVKSKNKTKEDEEDFPDGKVVE